MKQKTYTFTDTEGKPITKTLAIPTNDRMVEFLKAFGKSSFAELLTSGGQTAYGIFLLDLAVDMTRLGAILDICLQEGSEGIDYKVLDLRASDEVVQDFFDQRARKFLERGPASVSSL